MADALPEKTYLFIQPFHIIIGLLAAPPPLPGLLSCFQMSNLANKTYSASSRLDTLGKHVPPPHTHTPHQQKCDHWVKPDKLNMRPPCGPFLSYKLRCETYDCGSLDSTCGVVKSCQAAGLTDTDIGLAVGSSLSK